ncbi:thioredoxin family protein [Bordetella petrii]|uniref:thioredoxin family protein n=1 Tax=Bordetella petrii TaxID=94624 RepID=UPI001E641A40|nr:thioredoxin family protein [Bordetella petrii]MCD0503479.1 thioredoxin family protein [Bordetella petrii]
MPLLVPGPDTPALRDALRSQDNDTWLVACFCAAWCDTCGQYRPKLASLAAAQPRRVYAWIDIEDHPDLLGDEDVENFPTLLVQIGARVVFYGPMLPHIAHLERLLESLGPDSPAVSTGLPNVPALLAG